MKRIISIFTIFLLVLQIDAVFNFKDLKDKFDPQSTVFVFDMHDVILDKINRTKKMLLFVQHPDKSKFLSRLKKCGINPGAKSHDADIAIEKELIQDGDSSGYVDGTLALINSFTPNQETLDFIQSLHQKGFKIFGCSNIGPKSLEYLKAKYSNLAAVFDKCFVGFQGPTKENNYLTKKDPQTYKECLEKIFATGIDPKNIVFIDDSPEKISVAEKFAKFKGYRFISSEKLKQDFTHLL